MVNMTMNFEKFPNASGISALMCVYFKGCVMITSIELYTFTSVMVTLIKFQGHSGVVINVKLKVVFFQPVLILRLCFNLYDYYN